MSIIAQIQWNNWVNLNSDFTSELKGKSWRKESGLSFVPSQSKFSRRRWWEISLTPLVFTIQCIIITPGLSGVSPKTHYEWITDSPSPVNLRHNNCLEWRERALSQHCTCPCCLVSPPILHPLPLISRWMPSLLRSKSNCLSALIARTWKLDNWWIQRIKFTTTMML